MSVRQSQRAHRLTPTQIVWRRRTRRERRRALQTQRRVWSIFFSVLVTIGFVIPLGAALTAAVLTYLRAAAYLPPPALDLPAALRAGAADADRATEFYDASGGRLLFRARDPLADLASWTPLETLPPYVIEATLIAEDPDYLTAAGFNLGETLLRLWQTLLIGPPPPDVSITARLARAVLLGLDGPAADDRALEIALVAALESRYTPQQILEWHLNTNHYGGSLYGIDRAARTYFNKRAVDLTLDEAALLAAIPLAPQYNPYDNEVAARSRQRDLLRAMLAAGAIAPDQYERAAAVTTVIQPSAAPQDVERAPEYLAYARRQAEAVLDGLGLDGARLVARGGLRITTALDLDLQAQAECALRARIAALNRIDAAPTTADGQPCAAGDRLPPLSTDALLSDGPQPDSGAIVIIDAPTGMLRALVGPGTTAAFQPAGTLLPIVYFEGFNGGLGGLYTPARMVFDIPMQFPGSQEGLIYTVSNLDGRFRGPMNLRRAMGAALIPPAADVAYRQGMSNILRTAHLLGLNSLDENGYDLMLLERGGAVAPLDLAYVYSVFAALGDMRGAPAAVAAPGFRARDPAAVLRIEAADGGLIWAYDAEAAASCRTLDVCTPLIERGLAYLVNHVLADAETRRPIYGEGSPLTLSRPAAVVNAVSGDRIDHWTIGYTPQYVVAVHMARADRAPVALPGFALDGPASVWQALMEYAHARDALPIQDWPRPDHIIEALVCDVSGLAPNGVCPTHREIFLDGTQALAVDSYWQMVTVNAQTGQLATVNTPPALRSEVRYFVPPPEALDWWTANNQPLPPTEVDTVSIPQAVSAVRITAPQNYSYVGGQVTIEGQINADDIRFYEVAYGEGLNPTAWITLSRSEARPARGAPLAIWNTDGLDGLYSIRLLLTRADNSVDSGVVLVTVDNTAPTIVLTTTEPGRVYRFPTDSTIGVTAEVSDNLQISRVEFYHEGTFLGADTSWPYSFDWTIQRPGSERFRAVVIDAVGNTAEAELTVEVLRSGA
ncbi:MAG: penicillin-binding protein [Candidatus Flexifilum sp.]